MNAKLYGLDGSEKGTTALPDELFAQPVHEHLVWLAVKRYLGNQRQGTAQVKNRGAVSGGGKKPFKQKGTGNARQGSTRAPHYVGGGSVFGPRPRDYEYAMPKKVRAGALRSALSLKAKESKLVVVDELLLPEAKTKRVAQALAALGAGSALVVDGKDNKNLALSVRNLEKSKFIAPEGVNVYDVLNHDTLVLSLATVKALENRLMPRSTKTSSEGGA